MSDLEPYTGNSTTADLMPLDTTDDGLALLEKQAKAMDHAHRLATALCNTQMVPATFRGKPDDGAAAILYGAELGLKPQQALQQIFVVHGQPAIYARTMVALLKAKGYRFETVEDTPESVTVTATSPRGETETSTWTIERAQKAGYTGNKKYQTDPQAMLYAKAASDVSRKLAPDVLLGIKYTAEDLELDPQPVKATATRTDKPGGRGRAGLTAALAPAPADVVDDPLSAALTEIQDTTDRDLLEGLVEKWAGLVTTDDEVTAVAEAGRQRWTELAAEQMDNEHE